MCAQYEDAYGVGVPDQPDDHELERLAMAAAPFDPFGDDVVPFDDGSDGIAAALLPAWYMPAPSLRRDRTRVVVLVGVAIALVVINIAGVCVTYGVPDPVWK